MKLFSKKKTAAVGAVVAGIIAAALFLQKDVEKEKARTEIAIIQIEQKMKNEDETKMNGKSWKIVTRELQVFAERRGRLSKLEDEIESLIVELKENVGTQRDILDEQNDQRIERNENLRKILRVLSRFSSRDWDEFLLYLGPHADTFEVTDEIRRKFPDDIKDGDIGYFLSPIMNHYDEYSEQQPFMNFVFDRILEDITQKMTFWEEREKQISSYQGIIQKLLREAISEGLRGYSVEKLKELEKGIEENIVNIEEYIISLQRIFDDIERYYQKK